MHRADCWQLDDYLDDVLSAEQQRRFEQHIRECDVCEQAARFERRLGELARRAAENETAPPMVARRARARIRQAILFQRAVWISSAAAMLALLVSPMAVVWLKQGTHEQPPVTAGGRGVVLVNQNQTAERDVSEHPAQEAQAPIRATVRLAEESADDYIAVPQTQGNPSVTIVMLYPTHTKPEPAGQ